MRDIAILDGDSLYGSTAIIGWGQGFQSHILVKEDDGSHIHYVYVFYIYEYMVCLDIYLSLVV